MVLNEEEVIEEADKGLIKIIRENIFILAKDSETLESMHWYMWLDACFENDEFHGLEGETIRWGI